MAEEAQYDSATNKRKYEDNTPSPASGGRRTTGFSAPVSSQSPPPSYNNVPPPADEIQLAKQKAQEIAARLFNNVEAPKRARVENGDPNDNLGQRPISSIVTPPISGSYGYPGQSKKIEIPNARVGVIIGKGGETIKYLQLQSGAKIQVTRDMDADPNSPTRGVELTGTPEQISKAEQLIKDVLAEADTGGSGIISRRITGQQSGGAEQYVSKIPNNKVGLVIGKGGETIKNMQATSGARIQVIPLHLPPGDTSTERTLQIDGSSEQIEMAKQLVNEVISENRLRNPSMGGYPQQGYQVRPPTSWGPPGASMQQPGYGYMQPGAYPGQPPQYNMSQPPYSGYPPQPATGGYATGWDQTNAAPNQQTAQGGYDYYSQQPPAQHQQAPGGAGAPSDTATYGYNQPPTSAYGQGQGYGQDGYGGGYNAPAPQSGYGHPHANPVSGYDQQGYNSTSGYGNVSNPTPDGTASYGTQGDSNQAPQPVQSSAMGQQGYSSGQQPSPNPGYPSQGSTQPGYSMPLASQGGYGTQPAAGYGSSYGPPQGQKPPASQPPYGQPQQSPSAQGAYPQPSNAYPHSQPLPAQSGYAQPDSGAQRPPSSGYGAPAAQPGYGAPPYGAAPVSQPNYGQQQPPPYNAAYGGGYSQTPAYGDGSSGGNARMTYDSAPATQAAQPAKASPQS